ncbi:MAG: hypothetical protein IJF73_04420, partial [Clostridia bacterium]|nr:hypothetical protein [Clostridia bacterium]
GSTRTEAQLAVLSVLGEGVSDYYAGYESVLGEKFDAIKAYHLDPEAYLLLPAGLLFKTNALLAELEAGTFAGASAAAAYTAAIASDCESYYALDVKGTDFYDELYAQDGYVFGLDFFTLGRPEIWGDAAPAVPFKDVDLSGVTIADGMTETTTTYSNNADLKKALDTFKADHLKFTEQFITERDNASLNFGHYIGSSTTYALAGAVYEPATGSIRFRKDVQGANGIQPYNFPEIVSDNVSFQLIMAPNEGLSNAFFFFYNIRPTIDESYNITGLSNGFTKTSHTKHAPIPRSGDAQMLTFTLENAVTNKADVTYSIRLWNELLSETKGSCTAIDNNTYIGWSQSTTMNLYAFRVYNAELTPEEIKQNHFADVAKYFRLNLMGMDVEDSDQMTALYDAVANISLTSSTRAEAQLAVLSVLAEEAKAELGAAYADLKAEYTAPEEAALVALAAKYLLPIDVLEDVLTSARDMSAAYDALTEDAILGEGSSEAAALFFREQADLAYYYYSYAHLDPENETWTDYLDVLAENRLDAEAMMALPHADRLAIVSLGLTEQEALDAEVDKVMEKYVAYAAEKANKYTVDDYNALYVRDGLFFAADFFGTNALWGADGADVADKGSLIDYAWLTEGKAAMEITSAATVADGKLVMDANHLKVAPAGSMTAADYNMTVEHVLDVKALSSNSKPFSFRDIYLNAWSNDGLAEATKEAGAAYAFSGFNSDFGPSTWNYINSHNQGAIAGFTRPILTLNSAITYTFRKGASTLSYVMNFADYLDLSQAEVEALRAEVLAEEREPVVSIHSAGADTVAYPVPDAPLYLDFENCVLGWRVYLPNGNERQWVDEDFNLYFVGKSTAEKKEILDAITSADEYKLYATEEEAKAAIAAHAEAHPEDENNGKYATDRFYAIALDETPYGVHPELLRGAGWTDTIGGTATFTGDVYAIRYYSRALTKAETLQNHFADLAKYFRLDIGNYLAMSDDEKLALHEAMAACQLTDSRESVLDAYYAGCAAQYANLAVTDDADVNAALAAFAAAVGLDASRLVTLSAGEAFVGKILALADPAYATSRDIVNYRLDKEILDFYGATAFAGISVRVDNGTLPTEAGVRALYSIDEATLREMIRKYGVDSKLSFGAKITVNGVAAATLTFTATLAEDGSLSYEGTNSAGGTAAVKKVNGKLAFSYTVTYGDGDLTEENLNAEYSFVRFVTIAGEDVVVDHGSAIFGATVSAAEAYGYFAEAYAEDAVVAKVTAALTPAE